MAHAGATFLGGVLLGAVAGGTAAVFVGELRSPDDAAPASAAQFDRLEDALERAVIRAAREARRAEVPASRADGAEEPPGPHPNSETAVAPPGPEDRAGPRVPASNGAEEAATRRDPSTPLPPKSAARLAGLVVGSEETEEARRRDWLFLAEESVLRELGTPDGIDVLESGTERWTYRTADGGELLIDFRGGRVIALWGLRSN